MSKTTAANFDERQAEIEGIKDEIQAAASDLSCAESCETAEDFDVNVSAAEHSLHMAMKELKELRQ